MGDDETTDKQQAAITSGSAGIDSVDGAVVVTNLPNMVHTIVARPDGLVREVKEQTVISREQVDELLETEDVRHLGDFSDEVSALFFFVGLMFFYPNECISFFKGTTQSVSVSRSAWSLLTWADSISSQLHVAFFVLG